ncbi:GET complex subunit get1 [Boothiomyces sp. JEL0866]|nr:GET complex subunit get1 [Boothiomyces sp. JEL0866]
MLCVAAASKFYHCSQWDFVVKFFAESHVSPPNNPRHSHNTSHLYDIWIQQDWVFKLQQHLFNSTSTIQIQKLKAELLSTRKELLQTSAQDEFAKWAKLKRTLDKLTVEYDECAKSIAGKKAVTVTFVSWGLPGILWAFQILLLIIWRAEPVFYIPEQWFGPITNWLKFPFAPEGVFYWWSALKSVLDRSTAALTYVKEKRKLKQD